MRSFSTIVIIIIYIYSKLGITHIYAECGSVQKCPLGNIFFCDSICNCGCEPEGSECFVPGTKISTPSGEINIEDLKPGDKVLSFDENNEIHEASVSSVITSIQEPIYTMTLEDGTVIKATGDHPLLLAGRSTDPIDKIKDFFSKLQIWWVLGWHELFGKD